MAERNDFAKLAESPALLERQLSKLVETSMAVATSYGFAIIGAVIILVGGWAAAAFVHRAILRVARTIADLEKGQGVKRVHVAEALSYRRIMPGRGLAAD